MACNAGPKIVNDGLVLALDAGNTESYPGSGTTWTDLSGKGNNGTLTNGPTFDSGNVGSIVFDGTDDYVTLGETQINTPSGTIGFWLKLDVTISPGFSGNQRPFGRNNNFEARWSGGANPSNLSFDFGVTGALDSSQGTWLNTQWYYIVITWSETGNVTRLYVNNVLNKTGTCGTVSNLTGDFYIGNSSTIGASPLDGKIAMFHSYNRELTASEIKQNYDAHRGRYGI